jgi:hypothetical protein
MPMTSEAGTTWMVDDAVEFLGSGKRGGENVVPVLSRRHLLHGVELQILIIEAEVGQRRNGLHLYSLN